ncbi:hypothetical protein MMPV_007249 [Pyropia vietnamensis]
MAGQAKAVLVRTAERRGIPWAATRDTILDTMGVRPAGGSRGGDDGSEQGGGGDAAAAALAAVTDPNVAYPDYYLRPFHAYPDGNLCWEAAAEAEPATLVVGVRTFPDENLSPAGAFDRLRAGVYEAVVRALDGPGGVGTARVGLVVDVGCGVGLGTVALRSHLLNHRATGAAVSSSSSSSSSASSTLPSPPDLQVVGVDLSPYMLAVATARAAAPGITYRHGRAEALPVPPGTAGVVALQFIIHEMPAAAIAASLAGAYEALAPGGVLCVLDNNPASTTLRRMPPTLYSLMKSTEPHSDEYYPFDVEAAAVAVGFGRVVTIATDHRHRTVTAVKPGLEGGV